MLRTARLLVCTVCLFVYIVFLLDSIFLFACLYTVFLFASMLMNGDDGLM